MTAIEADIPRDPTAPARARQLLRGHLDQVPSDVRANAELVVSELVTNAIRHGSGAITLRVQIDADIVRGEVIDEGRGFESRVRAQGVEDVGGRGLRIVASLASRWGVHDGSSHVWFELPLRPTPPAASPPALGEERRPSRLD